MNTTTRGRYAAPTHPLRRWLPYAAAALALFAVLTWAATQAVALEHPPRPDQPGIVSPIEPVPVVPPAEPPEHPEPPVIVDPVEPVPVVPKDEPQPVHPERPDTPGIPPKIEPKPVVTPEAEPVAVPTAVPAGK